MFNLYQTMNRHAEGKEQKEPETTGHDRFYQERVGRSSFRKKRKPACRRAQSAAEFNPASIAAANKRAAFRARSVSTENESEEEGSTSAASTGEKAPLVAMKIDSLAKLLFNKSLMGSPSGSLKGSPVEENNTILRDGDRCIQKSAAGAICIKYLEKSSRYEFISQLNDIGSRADKHWFAVKDYSIKTERLLTLTPLTADCPIEPSERSRSVIIELFRALHHPYIYPVLDVAFYSGYTLSIIPFNQKGSLKDLIYKTQWQDDWCRKHSSCDARSSVAGLPMWQVGRLGRQVLEGLLFLADRGFPPYRHLHSGNVIVQNGVARISGLENSLLGMCPRGLPLVSACHTQPEVLALGHLMFEMCAGYELDCPAPTPGHLQLDLERYPQVVEVLEVMFSTRTPTLGEVVLCDLFRKIDLREMKGSCLPNFNQRLSNSCVSLLNQVCRSGAPRQHRSLIHPRSAGCSPVATPVPRRRHYTTDDFETSWYSYT